MDTYTSQQQELLRLANLEAYTIIDTLPEQEYDDITHLAAQICGMPISLISFIDRDRQWFKSRLGFPYAQTERQLSFCAYTIQQPGRLMIVPDAAQDIRFSKNPLIWQDPKIMFYAGMPLVTEEGYALGTLCVIDHKPNKLSPEQEKSLKALARQVMALLSLRKRTRDLEETQASERREHRLREHLVNTMQEVVFQADRNGNWLFLNPAWNMITGYSVAESEGRPLLDFIVEEDRLSARKYLEQIRAGQQPAGQTVIRFHHKTDSFRYVAIYAQQTLTTHQEVDGMSGTLIDITQRLVAEQQVHELNERLKLATHAAGQGIWEYDLQTNQIFLDDWVMALYGLQPPVRPLLVNEFLNVIHPEDRSLFITKSQVDLAGNTDQVGHLYRVNRPDGTVRWIETLGRIMRDEQGLPVRIIGLSRDVTSRKQSEAELRESEQRFRQIADNVEEMFWIRDLRERKFLYINSAYEAFSGLPAQPLYADENAFFEFVFEDDRDTVRQAFQELDFALSYQFRARHRDGSWRWLQVRAFSIQDENEVPSRRIGISTDITPIIEKEQILEESLKKERDLNSLKSQFIATTSHEFKTPLAAIISSVELVRFYMGREAQTPFTAMLTKHLNAIFDKTTALNELIMDTLTLSKLEEGKIQVVLQETDLVAVVEAVITSDFMNRNDGRQVDVTVLGNPVPIQIDTRLTSHVLTNLLTNAFKFSATNPGLTIEFTEPAVRIMVTDQGIGIPEKDMTYLFGKFFRASNVQQVKGTGLGLAICREYVELQEGFIEVDSVEGAGTTFTVTLPHRTP